ncbi:MAG: hypothetical protein QXN08_03895 [Nitrososphaerales archaeon]
MEILLGEPFRLPRLGEDVFRRLMRDVRLEYDRQKRVFRTTTQTDLYQLSTLLSEVLKEPIIYTVKCFICGSDAGCTSCEYSNICDRLLVSQNCLCKNCLNKEDAYTLYCMRVAETSL